MIRFTTPNRTSTLGDTARFLGLPGWGSWAVAALFLATQLILSFTSGLRIATTPANLIALLILIAVTVVVMLPGRYPLSHWSAVAIVAGVTAMVGLVDAVLPTRSWPGYESWQFGAGALVLLALGLRGRNLWAWVGMALMTALAVYWTVSIGHGVLEGINLVDRNAGTLLIGTLFSIGVRRSIGWISSFHLAEQLEASDEAFTRAKLAQRQAAVHALNDAAIPALELIASGRTTTTEDRTRFLVVEAGLRDGVRAPTLAREPLASAVREARFLGREVVLFDDAGVEASEGDAASPLLVTASEFVRRSSAERITLRLSVEGASDVALTMVEDADAPRIVTVRPRLG